MNSLSLTKQGTADTIISTSVRLDSRNPRHHTRSGANSSAKTVTTRVSSALRTLSTLFGSGKSANSRAVKPIIEEKGIAAATQSNSHSHSQSQSRSASQSQDMSPSQSEDRSDRAVPRLMNSSSFRNATAELHRSGSSKNFNTNTIITSAKHTLQVLVQANDKNTNTSSKNNTISLYSNPNPNLSTNSNTTNTITNTITNTVTYTTTTNTITHTSTSAQQPYHQSVSGLKGQELAQRMLTRLEDLPDIPDELLGTVIYLPAASNAKAGSEKGTSDATSGVGAYNTSHSNAYSTYNAHNAHNAHNTFTASSNKTVSQDRLAAYFHPLALFSSIEDLCDPSVIERIPNRMHPFMQPPRCVSRLSVEVWGAAELDSSKTEAYNQPTGFAPGTANINISMFPTYYNTAFLTTSPNDVGSPCMSVQEEEEEENEVVHKPNASAPPNSVELEGPVAFSAHHKPASHNTAHSSTNNTSTNNTNTSTPTAKLPTAAVGTEKHSSRVVRPIVSMLRNALQGHARVGVAAGEE